MTFEDPPFAKFLFGNTKLSVLWLAVRLYVGWQWLHAGWEKLHSPLWVGEKAGVALAGFMKGALEKTGGPHPDVQGWYADFLQNVVIPHAAGWSKAIAVGEFVVGILLIVGLFAGIAAFAGLFMNFNFLFAGAVSINPIMIILSLGLLLAWKVAGHLGLDRFVLPAFGTPWQPGKMFKT